MRRHKWVNFLPILAHVFAQTALIACPLALACRAPLKSPRFAVSLFSRRGERDDGASRFSEDQIIGILKEHQVGIGAKELCRPHGISDCTFYKWRSKSDGMEVSEAKRLKVRDVENAKLKKMLAEQMLDDATL